MKSDKWQDQNEWWNNKLKANRHKLTYLLPYTRIYFIILGGKDLPEVMAVLLEFIKNDPIAQGDPSKFFHDVLFFLQFNNACHKPDDAGKNSKRIQGWTDNLRAEYAKHTPIIEQLHSCAITGMGVTESWSNPKSYTVLPSQCKTPTWMTAVLNPAIAILRKTNKPLLNLRKFFMEMEPANSSDKWHYADTHDNTMRWFTTFAICAHFCYNASHMKHAGEVIWRHQHHLQPHPHYGHTFQPDKILPTSVHLPIEPTTHALQIPKPALENLKDHCYQYLRTQQPVQHPNHINHLQYPAPQPWSQFGIRRLIKFHQLEHLQPSDLPALPPPPPPPSAVPKPPPPPRNKDVTHTTYSPDTS